MFELSELKKIRKKLGLTQSQLAKQANVSQSLIAKIESNSIDPTFSKTKKIYETLTMLSNQKEKKASHLVKKKIFYVKPSDMISEAIDMMKKHAISQLPVIDKALPVGLITESIILDNLDKDLRMLQIKDVMGAAPPLIPYDSPIDAVADLLRYFPIVLVSDNSHLKGVITKADLLKRV